MRWRCWEQHRLTQKLAVKGFSRFFVTNQCPDLQDRACEIRTVIGCWLLTIKPFQLSFSHGHLPEAGREIQTELDRMMDDEASLRTVNQL